MPKTPLPLCWYAKNVPRFAFASAPNRRVLIRGHPAENAALLRGVGGGALLGLRMDQSSSETDFSDGEVQLQ